MAEHIRVVQLSNATAGMLPQGHPGLSWAEGRPAEVGLVAEQQTPGMNSGRSQLLIACVFLACLHCSC